MRHLASLITGTLLLLAAAAAQAAPSWIWDTDGNGVDDRIEAVETQGLIAAHVNGDLSGRLRFDVVQNLTTFTYGIYVKYAWAPGAAEEQALTGLGLPVHRYRYIPYIRSRATFAQIQQILGQPGVLRVESIPIMYATNDNGTQSMQAAPSENGPFPTVSEDLGITGRGVVVGILDTGVNDEPDSLTGFPGHESLKGKFLGGGEFWSGQPELNTPITGSKNPVDRSPDLSHGTHVAGSAIGTGGPTGVVTDGHYGFYRGVAPDARLVDCKVLSDGGTGFGTADGLEWCIYHKNDDWGLTGADSVYRGIQVLNMSLGGTDASDGTDASSAAVNAAVKAGLTVVVASGNDGETNYIAAPAAADLAITAGAVTDFNTHDRGDDIVADYSNEGPRTDDGDTDHTDEMKPDVCSPGSGITSAEGVLTADGHSYVTVNGTSMACPMTAGVAALIVNACPGIAPRDVKRILRDTAGHRTTGGKQPASAVDPFGIDPNYHPSWGWGNTNAYAATMEARFPHRTQVVRESGEAVVGGVDVHWTTQREVDLMGFNVLRADPLYGRPGPFQAVNPSLIEPAGAPEIHGAGNRTAYTFQDRDPGLVPGETYRYRVQWRDLLGRLHDEPAFDVVYDPPTPLAKIQWSITHNYIENDLLIYVGAGTDASDPTRTARFFFPAGGSTSADSMQVLPGQAFLGTEQYFFSRVLTDRDFGAAQVLPPGPDNPWFLSVTEAGYVNTSGRINDFRITVYRPQGDTTYTPPVQLPLETVENVTHVIWIPSDPALNLVNHAPALDPIGDREAQEGAEVAFTVSGSDPDGDPLTFAADGLPAGASFDAGTRAFSWTPGYDAVTTTTSFPVTFRVADDAGAADSETVAIRVHDVDPNQDLPPYWDPVADQSVVGGNTLSFKVRATDPENGTLAYSASGLPAGAAFDGSTRTFTWPTTPGDVGDYSVDLAVTDGSHAPVTEPVQITVKGAIPPLLGACESETSFYTGTSDIGSADAGAADRDTVMLAFGVPLVRMTGNLSWTGAPVVDLDIAVYDMDGNSVGGAGSLSSPETFIIDNLAAGQYRAVVTGYTVPVPTDWTLQIDACRTGATPVTLSHFNAHPGEGTVTLEWATSSEVNHAGFRVYRSAHSADGFAAISDGLVTGADGVYQFTDPDPLSVEGGVAYYELGAVARDGSEDRLGPWTVDLAAVRPAAFTLAQNAPNPFAAAAGTAIKFRLPVASEARLEVFDVRGALVRTLADGRFEAGEHAVTWDASDFGGRPVARGVYFYRLAVPGRYVETRRMVLTR